jgi:twitching motility protein PilT
LTLTIKQLLQFASDAGASDLHISTGSTPMVRVNGIMKKLNLPVSTVKEVDDLIFSVMNESQKTLFMERLEFDFSTKLDDNTRFRVNAFHQLNGRAVAFRVIPNEIRSFDELNLPDILGKLALKQHGLILVTGPTGSGKSTTLATMIDVINDKRHSHIISIEDPIDL